MRQSDFLIEDSLKDLPLAHPSPQFTQRLLDTINHTPQNKSESAEIRFRFSPVETAVIGFTILMLGLLGLSPWIIPPELIPQFKWGIQTALSPKILIVIALSCFFILSSIIGYAVFWLISHDHHPTIRYSKYH